MRRQPNPHKQGVIFLVASIAISFAIRYFFLILLHTNSLHGLCHVNWVALIMSHLEETVSLLLLRMGTLKTTVQTKRICQNEVEY